MLFLRVVPGLAIAAEEARHPHLRSQPLIMGGLPRQRGVVREANLFAQRCGIRPGITLAQAHQSCPEGVFLVPDVPHYIALWETICDVLRTITPLVESVEPGQAVCDLQGCERRWGDEWNIARQVAQAVREATGIVPWFGVAPNRLLAELASTIAGTDSITQIERGGEALFLRDLPLTMLPEIDTRLALTFQVLGLTTVGQLAALPAAAVRQRFGALGERLHRYARGIDPRPVLPPPQCPQVSARYECEDGSPEEVMAALHHLAEECAQELEHRHLEGRMVQLVVEWESPRSSIRRSSEGGVRMNLGGGTALPVAQPSSGLPARPIRSDRGADDGEQVARRKLPIPYRIHSMLPQPNKGSGMLEPVSKPLPLDEGERAPLVSCDQGSHDRISLMVRTPIGSAPPLLAQAQRLLPRVWKSPREQRMLAIELVIREFAQPAQLSFDQCNRLDGVGGMAGLSMERRRMLADQDELLSGRYGRTPFQHVARVDPGNVLAERRFVWAAGLSWEGGSPLRRRS